MENCNNLYCPWVQNNRDSNHYVCLKCGRERKINNYELDNFWLFLAVIVVMILIVGNKLDQSSDKLPNKVNKTIESRELPQQNKR